MTCSSCCGDCWKCYEKDGLLKCFKDPALAASEGYTVKEGTSCSSSEELCANKCYCYQCWGKFPDFPGECRSVDTSVCGFGDTEFIYPDQLSLKIVASNVQAGPKYDYEPDADTDGMKEFLNGLDLAFFRDPQYDEITPWEQWYAYSTHPTIDVTTCEELQENPYGADLAWGYYDCTNNRGETRDTLYGVSPNLISSHAKTFKAWQPLLLNAQD